MSTHILLPNMGVVDTSDTQKLEVTQDLLHEMLLQTQDLAKLLGESKNYTMSKDAHKECVSLIDNILIVKDNLKKKVAFTFDFIVAEG